MLRRLAITSLGTNVVIVVTGGAVRLTGSGLGCPTVPRCTSSSLVPTSELGVHGIIEFTNRMLTWVLVAVALATLVAALRERPRRRDVRRLATALFLGIPVQAVIGAVTVRTQLNPWVVTLHFVASMLLIGLATVLVRRVQPATVEADSAVPAPLRLLARGQLAVLAGVVYLGTVVTASGPHAGDRTARRTGLDLETVAQAHADGVFLLLGLSTALLIGFAAVQAPRRVRRAAAVLLGLEFAQGLVGFVQYLTDLPAVLVGVHLLGAALLVVAATDVALAVGTAPGLVLPAPRPGRRTPVDA